MVNRYNNKKRWKKGTKKTEKRVKSFPNLSPTQLWMCVCGERMAWEDGEMEGKECWLGNTYRVRCLSLCLLYPLRPRAFPNQHPFPFISPSPPSPQGNKRTRDEGRWRETRSKRGAFFFCVFSFNPIYISYNSIKPILSVIFCPFSKKLLVKAPKLVLVPLTAFLQYTCLKNVC